MGKSITFFNVSFKLANRRELLDAIHAAHSEEPVRIATLNPEIMLAAQDRADLRQAIASMTHCSVDGSGLFMALRAWRAVTNATWPLERYTGATLVDDLFKAYQDGSKSFFLLGGGPDLPSPEVLRSRLEQQYPGCRIAGILDPGAIAVADIRIAPSTAEALRAAKPDIVLAGFGAPKQELWIQAAQSLGIPVMIGVGGTFGFYTRKNRAPRLMQSLHLEWLYRTLTEKGHAKRAWRAVVVFSLRTSAWMLLPRNRQKES